MRRIALVSLLALSTTVAGCAARQVEVSDGPAPAQQASVAIRVSNTLGQAVNVYLLQGSSETFVRQVAANSTQLVNLPGVSAGETVTLRARTVDGTRTFTSDAMAISSGQEWRVP